MSIVTVALVATAGWLYMVSFDKPSDAFKIDTILGFKHQPGPAPAPTNNSTDQSTPTTETTLPRITDRLRQLTIRPSVGYWFPTYSDNNELRYVERGTGHIYSLNPTTGRERKLTQNTFSQVTEAYFNQTGTEVVLVYEDNYKRKVVLGRMQSDQPESLQLEELPQTANNIYFDASSTLHYTLSNQDGTVGYSYQNQTENPKTTFSVPFRFIKTFPVEDGLYFINQYATTLTGAVYKVSDDLYQTIFTAKFGLSAQVSPEWYLISFNDKGVPRSIAYNRNNNQKYFLDLNVIPEKCVLGDPEKIRCAGPRSKTLSKSFQSDWYRGVERSDDVIWEINPKLKEVNIIADPVQLVGLSLDIIQPFFGEERNVLWFINKNDDTLWQYDL